MANVAQNDTSEIEILNHDSMVSDIQSLLKSGNEASGAVGRYMRDTVFANIAETQSVDAAWAFAGILAGAASGKTDDAKRMQHDLKPLFTTLKHALGIFTDPRKASVTRWKEDRYTLSASGEYTAMDDVTYNVTKAVTVVTDESAIEAATRISGTIACPIANPAKSPLSVKDGPAYMDATEKAVRKLHKALESDTVDIAKINMARAELRNVLTGDVQKTGINWEAQATIDRA